ncbi:hypothetical protein WA171_000734 [Blastocystis sp. BT1]
MALEAEDLTDDQWLKSTEDISILAEAALKEMKRSSSIHLYDDFQIVKILDSKKTIAGYSRSLLLKLSISSKYFKSQNDEEPLSFLVLRHNQNGKYSFALPSYPEMLESFIYKQEEIWAEKHRQERDRHFEELQEFISSSAFENQDYLE